MPRSRPAALSRRREVVVYRKGLGSAGVVCYEMLTGQLPRIEFQPPSKSSTADPRFDPIVLRALERDRERRYQQMREMNSDVLLLTRTPESTLRITKEISAPIEKVFEAWTSPQIMSEWFAPTDDYVPSTVDVDLRVGGDYTLAMKHKDRPDVYVHKGQYCRIEAPNILIFTWGLPSHDPDAPETQVTVELRPNGPFTDLTLTHERFRDDDRRNRHETGWTGCLHRLGVRLAS